LFQNIVVHLSETSNTINMKILFSLPLGWLLCFASMHSSGQQNYRKIIHAFIDDYKMEKLTIGQPEHYRDVQGSPYLSEDFISGVVEMKDGNLYQGPLRYDAYAGQMEFRTDEGTVYAIAHPETIETIALEKDTFLYFQDEKDPTTGNYYQLIAGGDYSLLMKHRTILKDPQPDRPYRDATPAEFVSQKGEYCLYNKQTGLIPVRSKRDLNRLAETIDESLKSFVKKRKIKTGDKEDMVQFTEYLNAAVK